ncbi:type VII secretion integral membrane protein EccD [Nocardioides campestrisoli]|uniref:type VII secretion integral membrane protein EccD n=1 Tax=Nocardioides campestrisoli TaxID=2736757 RepID=UPI0015E6DC55|nr:type VII secretion integral membrane protein EccD [Nocardioides campestrisoli]
MSQTAASTSGLVRVTVTSGSRRVDLVLPSAVPVAELVPELARSVGLLDASTVYGGYRLVTQDGRQLSNEVGLTIQGVEDGGVLAVVAGYREDPPQVYDDVVEAMADAVEHELSPWEPEAGRRTALWSASLLLGLGAMALLIQGESLLGGVAAAVISALLVAGAVVLARGQSEPQAAVTVSLLSGLYAAVAGLVLAPGELGGWQWPLPEEIFAMPLVCAGAAVLLVGVVALVGLDESRALVLPLVVVGAVLAAVGGVVQVVGGEPTVVLTVVLTLVVVLGNVFPWLALGITSTKVDQVVTLADVTKDPEDVDPARVAADARMAHEILLSVAATIGVLITLVAPFTVDRGVAGTLLVVMCCLAVMLRTRQYRTRSEVLAGLVSGIAGLVAVAVSVLFLHPDWRAGSAVALAVVGAVLLVLTLAPPSPSVRRGRIGDVVESIALLSLLPLMVLAVGLFDAIRG